MADLGTHVGVASGVGVTRPLPRRAVGALLGEGVSDMVALDEAVLAARMSIVARLFLVAEFLCRTK